MDIALTVLNFQFQHSYTIVLGVYRHHSHRLQKVLYLAFFHMPLPDTFFSQPTSPPSSERPFSPVGHPPTKACHSPRQGAGKQALSKGVQGRVQEWPTTTTMNNKSGYGNDHPREKKYTATSIFLCFQQCC